MDPSEQLRERALALYRAMSRGEPGSVEAFYSSTPGVCFVGTDAAEFWTDPVQHNGDVRRYFDGSQGLVTWLPGDVLALSEGSIGWTVNQPCIRMPDGRQIEVRVTLVWRHEDGAWRVVHSHASIGG